MPSPPRRVPARPAPGPGWSPNLAPSRGRESRCTPKCTSLTTPSAATATAGSRRHVRAAPGAAAASPSAHGPNPPLMATVCDRAGVAVGAAARGGTRGGRRSQTSLAPTPADADAAAAASSSTAPYPTALGVRAAPASVRCDGIRGGRGCGERYGLPRDTPAAASTTFPAVTVAAAAAAIVPCPAASRGSAAGAFAPKDYAVGARLPPRSETIPTGS